ncbi:hypothetical protein [Nocardioides speluncae]|uniref:hypothetical protein n=1 Tax=Nocardioides speluncae TaxID=2670337 RepID=UPI000D68681F|nr:hypothetical protein [Nocardioides speluncae]
MKRLLTACAATAAIAVPLAMLPAAAHAEPTKNLAPNQIDRGPNPKIPYVDGSTVVDGTRKVKVNAAQVQLLGKAGTASYIVVAAGRDGGNARLLRVRAGQPAKVLARGDQTYEAVLSGNGTRVALTTRESGARTTIKVISTSTGTTQRTGTFQGSVNKLDFAGDRVLLSSWGPARTFVWNYKTNTRKTINNKTGYEGSFKSNRLAFYTADPFEDGCSVLTRITAPTTPIWRSCTDRVAAISPDASRLATIDILSDGLGPRRVTMRTGAGRALVTYKTSWFGAIEWETNRALLLETHGQTWTATVRATATTVNRATKLTRTVQP